MTTENVQPTKPADQPDHFAVLAAELHRVADDIATLTGSGLPKPGQFQLNIQPGVPLDSDDDVTAAAVDAMAGALLGRRGEVQKMSSGSYFYSTGGPHDRGPLSVMIYDGVSTEWALKHDVAAAEAELTEREAELEKARVRVAELRAARTPQLATILDRVAGGDAAHYEKRGWVGEGPGSCGVECACGLGYDGFDSLAEASRLLAVHIAASVDPEGELEKAHVAALVEDNDRAKAAIVASLRPGEGGRIVNPRLAQFLAGKEYRRREAAHFLGLEESAEHHPASDSDAVLRQIVGQGPGGPS